MWARSSLALLLALGCLTAGLHQVAAINAPHGAYLGCYDKSVLGAHGNTRMLTSTGQTSWATNLGQCAPACASANFGLAIITPAYECYCSTVIPSQAQQLGGTECMPGKAGVAAFYLHKDASTTLCRVSNPAMTASTWKIEYGGEHVSFNTADNSLSVALSGTYGARLETQDGHFMYGVYQIEGKISSAPGVVSSFYTRSSDVYPNSAISDFSEIDWEFLNANCGGSSCGPNTIWLNSYTKALSNGDRKVSSSDYQSLLGSSGLTSDSWTTYTINWQPDFVAWSLNGTSLQMSKVGEMFQVWNGYSYQKAFESPNLAMNQVISVWTDSRSGPENFGGVVDQSRAPYYSSFRNLRRVVCDQQMPTDADAAAAAMGPSWMYNVAVTPSAPPSTTPSVTPPPSSNPKPSPSPSSSPVSGAAPAPSASNNAIANYLQCGGMGGNCSMAGYTCGDAPYPGYTCNNGFGCKRTSEWYWQCVQGAPQITTPAVTASPTPTPSVAPPTPTPTPAPTPTPTPNPTPTPAPTPLSVCQVSLLLGASVAARVESAPLRAVLMHPSLDTPVHWATHANARTTGTGSASNSPFIT